MIDPRHPARHHIHTKRLEKFVEALDQVVHLHPAVHMLSCAEPMCGTPGCHAGLIHHTLPLLKRAQAVNYDFWDAASRLARYLFKDRAANADTLKIWAHVNSDLWGNSYGDCMWGHGGAFNQDNSVFPSQVIADHWRAVLKRYRSDTKTAAPK